MLDLDPEKLVSCVSCGLCLPHCPTFRVTGEEAYSPRGRIDAMRAVESGNLAIDDQFVDFMETCVQCRGCEPACPSGVEFGALMEGTREVLAREKRMTPSWQRLGLRVLDKHRLLLAGSSLLAVAQRLHLVPKRFGLSAIPLRRPAPVRGTGTEAWLYTGCVMDAWQRRTHHNTAALLGAAGIGYAVPRSPGCCGALHTHAGLTSDARRLATSVMNAMPGESPIVVNSAGCGAAMKDFGHLLGTDAARVFSARVVDVNEFLAERVADLPAARGERPTVILQDPCHLRHVQRVVDPVRVLVGHVADVVELDDDGLCCGAGGAYSVMQPDLAGQIRDRKVAAIDRAARRSGATVVASSNPGCSMHLAAVLGEGMSVEHPVDVVAQALGLADRE